MGPGQQEGFAGGRDPGWDSTHPWEHPVCLGPRLVALLLSVGVGVSSTLHSRVCGAARREAQAWPPGARSSGEAETEVRFLRPWEPPLPAADSC